VIDPRLELIRAFIEKAAASDRSLAGDALGHLEAIDREVTQLSQMDGRLARIADTLTKLARLEFDARAELEGDGGQLDAIVAYVNMLSEELFERLQERKRAELELERRIEERTRDVTQANQQLQESLSELRATQRKLMDASRRAGMSDVATSVLHNVGNVLNSVNVSTEVIAETLGNSRVRGLQKVASVLREHRGDLSAFFSSDPVGRRLPDYLLQLAVAVESERTQLLDEVGSLRKNVEHIKVIVSLQQANARSAMGLVEAFSYSEAIDDALRLVSESFSDHHIQVVRDFPEAPLEIVADRHMLLQIITNLLSNARHAVQSGDAAGKEILLRLRTEEGFARLEVQDNGCGIRREHLARIFGHGFTTKRGGHGFGLHGAACATTEMGGRLAAHSDGPGRGARFTLDVPLSRAAAAVTVGRSRDSN
jgi:two-component system NtrC family sensor kinase